MVIVDSTVSRSLEARFLADDGLWRQAPMLTDQYSFEPLPDVHNILVTGSEGFIASWLVRHLVTKYSMYNVYGIDKLDYCSSRHNSRMLEGRPNFLFIHGDVTDSEEIVDCLRRYTIDTVFHLAAHTHVDLSFRNSQGFTINNVLGTHNLLECAQKVGTIKRFYHISTDEVHGEVSQAQGDLKENSLLDPTNPYAATKAAAEMMVKAFRKSSKIPAVIIRLNNIYGPHQYPESEFGTDRIKRPMLTLRAPEIIPKFTNLLHRKMPLFIHGDGKHTRRYLYAGDAADAFDTILHKGELGEAYNVDSRDEVSNFDLATKLLNMFGIEHTGSWIQWCQDRPFNDRRYAVDGSKLRELGWKQSVPFDAGLAATVDWYGKFSSWWGPIENTLLAAFPVVKEGHVVEPEESRMIGKEATVGAESNGHPTLPFPTKASMSSVPNLEERLKMFASALRNTDPKMYAEIEGRCGEAQLKRPGGVEDTCGSGEGEPASKKRKVESTV